MKKLLAQNLILLCFSGLAIIFLFSNCGKYYVKGYTEQALAPRADSLQHMCHFVLKSTIDEYVNRFNALRDSANNSQFILLKNRLYDTCSFNSFIIREILGNDSCIGLRVLNGLDANYKLHAILVGVDFNYNTLYIHEPINSPCTTFRKEDEKRRFLNKHSGPGATKTGPLGGAEMGQYP